MIPDPQQFEERGIRCPKCGGRLDRETNGRHGYVAKSYASPGGIYRLRYCSHCHEAIETIESAVGREIDFLDISDLGKEDRDRLRSILRQLRKLLRPR